MISMNPMEKRGPRSNKEKKDVDLAKIYYKQKNAGFNRGKGTKE